MRVFSRVNKLRWSDSPQAGFGMTETIISSAAVLSILTAIGINVQAVREHMSVTERILAMDHLERNISALVTDSGAVRYSVLKSGSQDLRRCVIANIANSCQNGRAFRLSILPEGHREPITGPDVFYDQTGTRCTSCASDDYLTKVETFLQTNCSGTSTCARPNSLVMLTVISSSAPEGKVILKERRRYGEVRDQSSSKFPNLSIECSSPSEVLRGIGLLGQAICEPLSAITYTDENGDAFGPLNVLPRNCSAAIAANDREQSFVTGFDTRGNVICGDRFW